MLAISVRDIAILMPTLLGSKYTTLQGMGETITPFGICWSCVGTLISYIGLYVEWLLQQESYQLDTKTVLVLVEVACNTHG